MLGDSVQGGEDAAREEVLVSWCLGVSVSWALLADIWHVYGERTHGCGFLACCGLVTWREVQVPTRGRTPAVIGKLAVSTGWCGEITRLGGRMY